jgi:hypothetical protein
LPVTIAKGRPSPGLREPRHHPENRQKKDPAVAGQALEVLGEDA